MKEEEKTISLTQKLENKGSKTKNTLDGKRSNTRSGNKYTIKLRSDWKQCNHLSKEKTDKYKTLQLLLIQSMNVKLWLTLKFVQKKKKKKILETKISSGCF